MLILILLRFPLLTKGFRGGTSGKKKKKQKHKKQNLLVVKFPASAGDLGDKGLIPGLGLST